MKVYDVKGPENLFRRHTRGMEGENILNIQNNPRHGNKELNKEIKEKLKEQKKRNLEQLATRTIPQLKPALEDNKKGKEEQNGA